MEEAPKAAPAPKPLAKPAAVSKPPVVIEKKGASTPSADEPAKKAGTKR